MKAYKLRGEKWADQFPLQAAGPMVAVAVQVRAVDLVVAPWVVLARVEAPAADSVAVRAAGPAVAVAVQARVVDPAAGHSLELMQAPALAREMIRVMALPLLPTVAQ
ncbi:MAG TPA: hypothetical protein VFX54_12735 [Candidatus Binatia bacterium]|nr:hypothetical protein [Candidatus Binatia bacterium]